MACTPVGEGFIAFGWLGVFLVALAWGVFVGLADYAWQFPSPWAVIVATQLVLQMFDIEASAWPMSSGIRNLLLLVGLVWVPALVFRVVLLTGAPERLPPGRPPRAV